MMKTFKLDAEIYDVDYDGYWGKLIGPRSVSDWLAGLKDGEKATIEINSPGGSVIAGLAIANSIKNSKAKITAHVVGIAASMASVVACACDEIRMEEGAFLMIHNPWTVVDGDAHALRHQADILDSMKAAILAFYRGKFGGTPESLAEMMDAETWMSGRQAQGAGFLCEVVSTDVQIAAAVTPKMWANAPEAARAFVRESALTDEALAEIKASCEPPRAECEPPRDDGWEARYKGASRTINDLKGQLDAMRGELEAVKADFSSAVRRAESAEQALAQSREQFDRLNEAHRLLTGGVLTPAASDDAAERKNRELAAARTAEERRAIRLKYGRTA